MVGSPTSGSSALAGGSTISSTGATGCGGISVLVVGSDMAAVCVDGEEGGEMGYWSLRGIGWGEEDELGCGEEERHQKGK